ncbi:MAG: tRNA (guanosine(37)-N1)-methyltransferase TrmD [Chloroflexi bacterium]|nr:tRNA (guanosine(37)-N1)-methyltransferase TrmD [Chloroflexota bacterium]
MKVHILTLFPDMFAGPFSESMVKRAMEAGLVSIHLHDIRDYTHDKHHTVDDAPYGGGPGMVMKPEPVFEAVESILGDRLGTVPVILTSPQGERFTQAIAQELSASPEWLVLCGHYQGIDDRVREHLATREISLGDYVLTGGEIPAMVIVDAVVRLVPGVLGCEDSATQDSFAAGLLQHPLYTRPPEFRGWAVPEILLSGDHAAIARWRRRQALLRTLQRRPDLLASVTLTEEERRWLEETGDNAAGM